MWENLPKIIKEAAGSDLGIWALIILALSIIGYLFFYKDHPKIKFLVFTMLFIGFGLFGYSISKVKELKPPQPIPTISELTSPKNSKAHDLLKEADQFSFNDRNDEAREAYSQAKALYKAVDDRLGEANVLSGLGKLISEENPEKAKQYFYQAAHLYESIGMNYWKNDVLKLAKGLK